MTVREVTTRWLNWTVRRLGKERSSYDDRYHYDNNILYYDKQPIGRIMHLPDGNAVQLGRNAVYASEPKGWQHDGGRRLVASIRVPCVGAFSQFPIDVISDEQLHDRLEMLWKAEAHWLVEYANLRPIQNFVTGYGSANATKHMVDQVVNIARWHDQYWRVLGLKWDPFDSEHFTTKITDIVQWRLSEYHSPANAQKRERQQARREAKKAFDL